MRNDLLREVATDLGYAKGLLRDVLAASEAPADVREQCMKFAISRIRRDLGQNGRLAS